MLKPVAVTIVAFLVYSSSTLAQSSKRDTLSFNEGFFGMSYKKGEQKVSSDEFKQLLKTSSDQSIYDLYSKGVNKSTIADVVSFGGGFCVGYGLASKPTNSTVAIVGGAAIVVALIIDNDAKSMMGEAVTKYNSTVNSSAYIFPHLINIEKKPLFVFSVHL